MSRNKTILIPLSMLLLLLGQCKQRYDSPYSPPVTGYLVVEGNIAGNAPTQFTLSRVIQLPGDSALPMVTGAKVQVEGTDNSVYPLTETAAGVYTANPLPLNTTTLYRLRIATTDGETYLSDSVPYKVTPAIDSINWIETSDGVTIYANTHDPANNTRYYQWSFAETWEYDAAEYSSLEFRPHGGSFGQDTSTPRADSEYVFTCYSNDNSTSLLLGTSTKLAQDVIYEQKLQFIPSGSVQISVHYSILVTQYALTKDAYNFLSLMKANSESLGSIFDPQPSQLTGNIHSLTNPGEQVIGYISASAVQQQRIFISRYQLTNWPYFFSCGRPDTIVDPGNKLFKGAYTPLNPVMGGVSANGNYCVDCRSEGGTTKKPAFWPY